MAEQTGTPPRVYGVIPAAGRSQRMGRPKQSLPYGNSTVLGTVIESALAAGLDRLIVVVNPEIAEALDLPADKRFMTAILRAADAEMVDSVMLGIDRLSARHILTPRDGFLVCPGDMPALPASLIARCAETYRANPSDIVVAAVGDKLGHPVVAPLGVRGDLERLRGVGLKGLFEMFPDSVRRVETLDAGAQQDINTSSDYDAMKK